MSRAVRASRRPARPRPRGFFFRSGGFSMWIGSPSAALHASMNASGSVGCAWMVSATSSR